MRFIFPLSDVACLPIKHSTAEELAVYIWNRIVSLPVDVNNIKNETRKNVDNDIENVNHEICLSSSPSIENSDARKVNGLPLSSIGKQKGICIDDLIKRGIFRVEVNVAEAVNQEAKFSRCLYGACHGE